jgi:hypothetical protein
MTADQFSEILKILLQIANVVVIGYGLYKFLNKPHDTLSDEVEKLKILQTEQGVLIKEIKMSLDNSHEKHREQKEINAVFINCMLAFIDFEMAYCAHTQYEYSEDLEKAKKTLQEYLAKK